MGAVHFPPSAVHSPLSNPDSHWHPWLAASLAPVKLFQNLNGYADPSPGKDPITIFIRVLASLMNTFEMFQVKNSQKKKKKTAGL